MPAQRGARSHFQKGSCAARRCGGRAVPLTGRAAGTFLEAGNCQQEKKKKRSMKWHYMLNIQDVFLLHGHDHHLAEETARKKLGRSHRRARGSPHRVKSTRAAQVAATASARAAPALSNAARNKRPCYNSTVYAGFHVAGAPGHISSLCCQGRGTRLTGFT